MKKLYLIFLGCLFLFPFTVKASSMGMEKFYMDMTVDESGNLVVEEFFQMNGSYNGFERIIHPSNINAKTFTGADEDFGGSSIYDASSFELLEVRGIDLNEVTGDQLDKTFENIRKNGDLFTKVSMASSGDYGVYEWTGDSIKIYNPYKNKGFYVKYILYDVAILHNDIAEFGLNIFSDEMKEDIHDFRAIIHLPNNQQELRAFAHGPLTGNISLKGKNTVLLDIKDLYKYTAFDTRIVFDKQIIPGAKKRSGMDALDKILKYEDMMAKDANAQRERAKKLLKQVKILKICVTVGFSLWIILLLYFLFRFYKKHDKEYISTFKGKYMRDFPDDTNPEIIGYLMKKSISSNELSSSILNLVYKKKIKYEKQEKDYKLTLYEEDIPLSEAENAALDLVFDGTKSITMKDFKKNAKNRYSSFLSHYSKWHDLALAEAKGKNYFENIHSKRDLLICYSFLGIMFSLLLFNYTLFIGINILVILIGIISIIYLAGVSKRTIEGNESYHKWLGLKNFIEDFGAFEQRELPQIELWEKYLVYAVTFGSAKKLAKQMEIKISEYNLDPNTPYYSTYYSNYPSFLSDMIVFNSVINSSITSAHSSAVSASNIANSSSSSSGGFGGGFSSGGGSFGGGGGGGRF